MNYSDRINIDPQVMIGTPVIKGTRISVEIILRKLSEGLSVDQVLEVYDHLTKDDIYAALTYASDLVANVEIVIPHAS
jgi:uncharacterized protein (DUF433 family)